MTDAAKISQALGELLAGQKALQTTVGQLETRVGYIQTTVGQLQTAVDHPQTTVEHQGIAIADLQEGQKTLALKVEAFHTEQTKANGEIIRLISSGLSSMPVREMAKPTERLRSGLAGSKAPQTPASEIIRSLF